MNARSGELGVNINSAEGLDKLSLEITWIEKQKAPDAPLIKLCMAAQDWMSDPDGQTRRHLLMQLYSLSQLWKIVATVEPCLFDAFIFLRPDLDYLDKLDPDALAAIRSGVDLITPDWHLWGGLNDRFAFCSHRGAYAYTKGRYDLISQGVLQIGALHPESLLLYVARLHSLRMSTTSMKAARVRANGLRVQEDFTL